MLHFGKLLFPYVHLTVITDLEAWNIQYIYRKVKVIQNRSDNKHLTILYHNEPVVVNQFYFMNSETSI